MDVSLDGTACKQMRDALEKFISSLRCIKYPVCSRHYNLYYRSGECSIAINVDDDSDDLSELSENKSAVKERCEDKPSSPVTDPRKAQIFEKFHEIEKSWQAHKEKFGKVIIQCDLPCEECLTLTKEWEAAVLNRDCEISNITRIFHGNGTIKRTDDFDVSGLETGERKVSRQNPSERLRFHFNSTAELFEGRLQDSANVKQTAKLINKKYLEPGHSSPNEKQNSSRIEDNLSGNVNSKRSFALLANMNMSADMQMQDSVESLVRKSKNHKSQENALRRIASEPGNHKNVKYSGLGSRKVKSKSSSFADRVSSRVILDVERTEIYQDDFKYDVEKGLNLAFCELYDLYEKRTQKRLMMMKLEKTFSTITKIFLAILCLAFIPGCLILLLCYFNLLPSALQNYLGVWEGFYATIFTVIIFITIASYIFVFLCYLKAMRSNYRVRKND